MATNITHTVTRQYKNQGSTARTLVEQVTGNTERNAAIQVAGTTNNQHHVIGWLRADLQSLSIASDQAVTVYTNAASGGSPQDTIPLVAGQVMVWTLATDLIGKCPFSNDVTSIYITNSGGTAANIFIDSIINL